MRPSCTSARPSSLWDVTVGDVAPGILQSWSVDYGADTQRGTHPPKPPTLGFQLLLSGDDEEPDWTDGDRVHLRLSIDGAAEFTYFVGSLEGVKADRLTGRTILSARGYGLLALLPEGHNAGPAKRRDGRRAVR